jgi:AraC family transcriptional regulator of adaptative response/methylated-DNA-[protein]-cysteine methyltransferase
MSNSFGHTSTTDEVLRGVDLRGKRALIPAIRAAGTISLAIAPCSLGFVIIAVSEQLIRSIMVGDDPVMLVSDLQNQFPNNAIEVDENHDPGLVAKVVELLEYLDQVLGLPLDSTCIKSFICQ